jgi:hypothetical protein
MKLNTGYGNKFLTTSLRIGRWTSDARTMLYFALSNQLTNSMEQCLSWEPNRFSASQGVLHFLWNLKEVHYHVYKSPPPVCILNQIDPVHTFHDTSWKSILILSSHRRQNLPSGLLSGCRTKTRYALLLFPIRATCPAHLILFDSMNITRTVILRYPYYNRNWTKQFIFNCPIDLSHLRVLTWYSSVCVLGIKNIADNF